MAPAADWAINEDLAPPDYEPAQLPLSWRLITHIVFLSTFSALVVCSGEARHRSPSCAAVDS